MTQGRITGRFTGRFTASSTAGEVVAGIDLHDKRDRHRRLVGHRYGGRSRSPPPAPRSPPPCATPTPELASPPRSTDSLDCECVVVARLDLIDLGSIRNFAQQWSSTPLHVLAKQRQGRRDWSGTSPLSGKGVAGGSQCRRLLFANQSRDGRAPTIDPGPRVGRRVEKQ